jgi:hypothetical protein
VTKVRLYRFFYAKNILNYYFLESILLIAQHITNFSHPNTLLFLHLFFCLAESLLYPLSYYLEIASTFIHWQDNYNNVFDFIFLKRVFKSEGSFLVWLCYFFLLLNVCSLKAWWAVNLIWLFCYHLDKKRPLHNQILILQLTV